MVAGAIAAFTAGVGNVQPTGVGGWVVVVVLLVNRMTKLLSQTSLLPRSSHTNIRQHDMPLRFSGRRTSLEEACLPPTLTLLYPIMVYATERGAVYGIRSTRLSTIQHPTSNPTATIGTFSSLEWLVFSFVKPLSPYRDRIRVDRARSMF